VIPYPISRNVLGEPGEKREEANILPIPDLNQIIASPGNEPPDRIRVRRGTDQTPRRHSRRPTHGVHADPVRREDLVLPAVVLELEHADAAVGGGAGQEAAALVRGPGHDVHRGRVQGEVEDFGPLPVLFAPD